jgi:biopolymer transport protein ExbD
MKVPSNYLWSKKPRVEMLPLIDIVFLLLVFFIYAMLSMAVHRSLPVSLPVSSSAEISTELNVAITVNHSGEIFIDSTKVSLGELQSVLQEKMQQADNAKSVQVDLFADKSLSYEGLYRILDSIRTTGISNVSLQAEAIK